MLMISMMDTKRKSFGNVTMRHNATIVTSVTTAASAVSPNMVRLGKKR